MAFGSRDLSFASLHTSKPELFFVMDDSTPLCRARAGSTSHAAATCPKRTATTIAASANVAWQRRRRGASTRAVDRPRDDSRKIVKMPSLHARSGGEEHGSQLGDVLGSRPMLVRNDPRAPDADHALLDPRVYAHTMYFAVFWLHTMYFAVFRLHTMYFGHFGCGGAVGHDPGHRKRGCSC